VRRTHSGASLGVKGPGDLARAEWEADIPDWVFELLERNGHGSIRKVRYTLHEAERELVIDHFEGNLVGLVMLECAFESEESAASFELPSWAAGAVEVTHDPRFENAALALVSDVRALCASVMPAPPDEPTADLFGELERGRIVIDA
jgi:CYTH domain-containing protein